MAVYALGSGWALKAIERDVAVSLPAGWTDAGEVDGASEIRIVLAIKQNNLEEFEALFWEVTDPRNANYGEYLTAEQVTEMVAPSEEVVASMEKWLLDNGIYNYRITGNRDVIIAYTTVEVVEQMLKVDYRRYRHKASNTVIVKALGPYYTPDEIAENLDFIAGVTDFFQIKERVKVAPEEDYEVGPSDLRARYNVTGIGSANNSQAVAEFQAQYYSPQDLHDFFKEYVNYAPENEVYKVVGENSPDSPGIEASLDIQYIMGMAPAVQTWFYSNSSFDFFPDLIVWAAELVAQQDCPLVHSISYGDQSEFLPSTAYKDRLNTEFQQLGARGISIIFASGDSGTGCFLCVKFEPSFPATSPYVTSVGATRFYDQFGGAEAAVNNFGSGGGFSTYFDQPSYQTDAVSHYFEVAKNLPPHTYYTKSGRGTPDVAALGVGFSVYVSGGVESVAGTSCSAPTFSGIVSLLNEIRLAKGGPTMGFLNPFIYQAAANYTDAFFDVTIGDNAHGCCIFGFHCAPGWDPVSGVGTPNFEVLATLV